MLSHAEQILLLNEEDQGQSRDALFKILNEIKSLDIDNFDFDTLYNDVLRGCNFNVRKFIDDKISKLSLATQEQIFVTKINL